VREVNTLRAISVCPDKQLSDLLHAALTKAEGVTVVGTIERYPSQAELSRLLRSATPDVVFVSLQSLEEALAVARGVDGHFSGIQVVAVHDSCDSRLLLEVMRAGVREFLHPPFHLPALREALLRIHNLLKQKPREWDDTDLVFTFLPAKAGVGASTIALNFSVALSDMPETRVLLADFDLNSGIIGFLLKLDSQYSLAHAAESASRLDDSLWPQLVSTIGQLDVIPSGRINVGFRIEPAQIRHLLEFARRHYRVVCTDFSGNLEKYSVEVMHESKLIFLVTTPELPALHLAREKLSYLRSIDLEDRVAVLLNRAVRRSAVDVSEVEKLLGLSVCMTLPNDYDTVQKAVSEGKPVGRHTSLGKCFQRLAESLAGGKQNSVETKRRFVEYFSLLPARYSLKPSTSKNT
jgi:pilus assembly protein CpaE